MASSKDKKKNKLAQSSASWLGVKPGQLNKNIQTANKTVQQAQKQNSAPPRSNVQSLASWKGVTPSQVARPVQAAKPAQQQRKPSFVSLPTITPGRVSPAQQQRNAAQSARTLAQNDNSMRARIARSHEAERQQLAANAAAIKQDKSRLASNSLLWHQTTDAGRRRQLEQENAAIRTRRGFGYDARTGSTFDTKGNELSLGARMIYGGKAETAKQFQQVAQTRDFVRDTSRTASQPSIYDVARGVQADDPYYALEAGRKARNIVNGLMNRSGDTWTDADTKARDDARTALQSEMTALFRHYGVDYQPRWNEQQTADILRRAGADEGTVAYAMENVYLRDSTDRLGQGLEAIGKRAVASIPSLIDTAKQALANRNEDYENDEYRSLTEREQALEAQLQSMVSQNADGSVPEDYQRVYDELQNVRNRANALKTTKGVNPNTWSQTMLREANEAQANAEAGLAPAPRWLTEQAISLAGNAPSMAISTLPGGTILGSALIGAQAAGQRTFELNEQGKSAGEALGRGTVSGIIEAATEKLPLEQMAEILRAGGTGAVKSILRQMGTEATEEGISYFLNFVSDRAASDPDAEFSLAELVQSAAGGAFGGLIFGTAGNVASRLALGDSNAVPAEYDAGRYTRDVTAELQQADADLHAAKSLPEGAVRDRAIASAYQKMSKTLDAFTSQQIAKKAEAGARESLLTEEMQVPERTAATAPVEVAAPKTLDAAAQQAMERNRAAFDQARNIAQDAVQYGKTPEQAVYEAKVKREGEQVRAARKPALDTDGGLYEQSQQPMSVHPSEYINDQNRDFFSKVGAGNDRLPSDTQKTIFKQDMSRVKWLSDTDYQARHEHAAELRTAWEQVRQLDRKIEQFRERNPISGADERLLQATLVNRQTNAFNDTDAPEVLMHLYDLANERKTLMEPLREYSQARREALELNAQETADKIATYAKDKGIAAAYSRETMERNSYDIFGKDHTREAEELNSNYYEPVHKAVADKTKYVNSLKERVAKMHLNKHESAMVQMLMEGEYGGIAEYAKNNRIDLTPQLGTKLKKAAQEFRLMYNDMYERISDTLISNGMWDSIPGYLKNYAPHFILDAPQNMLQRIRFALGLGKDSTLTLRTDLAGITDEFRPGKKWFGNLLHREGEITDYDAVAGFERYINTAGDVIFLTDSVQNLRTLEDAIRYRLSDEGTREQISKIRSDISLDPLTRYQELDKAYNVDDTDSVHKLLAQKHAGMTGYVSNLREYINNLAGKKSKADRGWEDMLGRQMYNVARNVEGRVAANMIAANPGSWITNFIPITQATGEVSTPNLLRAMRDTVTSAIKDDGFEDASAFLTNRRGTERLTQTATQRASEIMGKPMECIDMLTSNVVVRGKYLENIQHGMDVQSAFEDADRFAANLMADRSQGAMPTAFNAVNPIRKIFTVFQLEVNNQLSYLFKDLPRAKQSASKLAWAYTKVFVGAYAFNKIYHELTGRDSAFDPIGMIADAFGQLTDDDEDDKKKRALNAATSLGSSIAENLPFIGGVLGGGRVPVSSALPSFGTIAGEYRQGYDTKRVEQTAAKELAKPATYLLLPFGGGAVNRAVQGYMTVKNGGSYRYDKNGEKMLQFPVFGQKPEDWAKAMLFGKSSLTEAQNWKDNGYDSLYAKETEAFDTLREHMRWHKDENGNVVDNSEAAYAAILALRKAEETAKEQHPDNYQDIAATLKRQILMNDKDLSVGQKEFLDRELISGGQSGDYSSRDAFDISQNVREGRQQAANVALKHGISADTFADLDGYLYALTQEQNDDGTKTYTTNTALGKVLEQIEANENYTAGEKEALSGYLLITAMSESDKDKYEEEVRGLVNPSDYVRFKSDLAEYQKEFEGTGADHAANVANILNSYTNLTDEQKSVLMNTYNDTAKNDVFHVSEYEKSLTDNSYYKSLNDSEKSKLRAYCNEYERAISEGRELSGWKAKAYMAKEAGIEPGTYALFQTALSLINSDGGNAKNEEITQAVKLVPGLTDSQRAYLWQAAYGKESTKSNPWGGATVTKYQKGENETVNPVEGGTISSGFGWRQSFQTSGGASSSNHKAIDIAAPQGTPVKAAMSGKIVGMNKYGFGEGKYKGYGVSVTVDCGNGITMEYHHMVDGSNADLNIGDEVKAGQQIGKVGSTGKSTGPHLDFQVVKDGKYVDPRNYIPGYGEGTSETISAAQAAVAASSGKKSGKSSSGGSKKSGGSGGSGGTSWSGLKNLKKPKGLPIF